MTHFKFIIFAVVAVWSLAKTELARADYLDIEDADYIMICLATSEPSFEQRCAKPTRAERAIILQEDFYKRDLRGQLTDKELMKLGRWWAILKLSADYCKGKNGELSYVDLDLHTQHQLDSLQKASPQFAKDYKIGEKTAARMIAAAKVSALSELGTIESPSDTWYCSQPRQLLPIVLGGYAPPTPEQTAEIDALLAEWASDPTPAVTSEDALLALLKDAPQDELYRLFGATIAMGIFYSPCFSEEILNQWYKVQYEYFDRSKLDESLAKRRRSGRDWSNENQFIIEQRIAARVKQAPMTDAEKKIIEEEYSLPQNVNPGDWQSVLNQIRENAAFDIGKRTSCVLFKREFAQTLVFARDAKE